MESGQSSADCEKRRRGSLAVVYDPSCGGFDLQLDPVAGERGPLHYPLGAFTVELWLCGGGEARFAGLSSANLALRGLRLHDAGQEAAQGVFPCVEGDLRGAPVSVLCGSGLLRISFGVPDPARGKEIWTPEPMPYLDGEIFLAHGSGGVRLGGIVLAQEQVGLERPLEEVRLVVR